VLCATSAVTGNSTIVIPV